MFDFVENFKQLIRNRKEPYSGEEVYRLIEQVQAGHERQLELRTSPKSSLCRLLNLLSSGQQRVLMMEVLGGKRRGLPPTQGEWVYRITLAGEELCFYPTLNNTHWTVGPYSQEDWGDEWQD